MSGDSGIGKSTSIRVLHKLSSQFVMNSYVYNPLSNLERSGLDLFNVS